MKELERKHARMTRGAKKAANAAAATGVNKAVRASGKSARQFANKTTGLPARAIGRRFKLKLADRRKPIDQIGGRVRMYSQKFSASYREPGSGDLAGRQMRNAFKLGRKKFAGAWTGRSNRYAREFVGRRVGRKAYPIVYPSVPLAPVGRYLRKMDGKAGRVAERETSKDLAKRLKKLEGRYA